MSQSASDPIAIIGAGPAGLKAAEVLAAAGLPVEIFEAKPSIGRKFLRAGIGGLNLTHAEPYPQFCTRFGDEQSRLQPMLDAFPPEAVRGWAADLGIETFEGTSGRVFPAELKAAPLLRAWAQRLRALGVRFRVRHRWLGWDDHGALRFASPDGEVTLKPCATVLALGGGSWPQLGSDAAWIPWLAERGVSVAPLQSANCGFDADWSPHIRERFSGAQLKPVAITFTDTRGNTETRQGELVITEYGLEGSLIYAFSRALRETIRAKGNATFLLDLAPGRSVERVWADVAQSRGARSMSSHLQSRAKIQGVKAALLREALGPDAYKDEAAVARAIKALPITVSAPRPVAEAISTAGGVRFESVNEQLMLTSMPGVFVAGEMLDWEAPTGGYLLTACLAQGQWAGASVKQWLDNDAQPA